MEAWKLATANGLIMFLVQITYALYELLPAYPSLIELYGVIIRSVVATLISYGYTKIVINREKEQSPDS
jgi:hypothetical protein